MGEIRLYTLKLLNGHTWEPGREDLIIFKNIQERRMKKQFKQS